MITGKTALVFGASGLIGGHLIKELIGNPDYDQVVAVARKPLANINSKILEISLNGYKTFDFGGKPVTDIHIFCCLGTTIKKAGTKVEFRKVDYDLPLEIATWAKAKGIRTFAIVSSIGASSTSGNFYLQTKGEMEDGIKTLHFPHLIIVRPSLLLGTRSEFRLGEEIAKVLMVILKYILLGSLKKYRPVKAATVARAMMILANSTEKDIVFESDRIEAIGGI